MAREVNMSTLYVKVYEGCPLATFLWSVVSVVAAIGAVFGFVGLFYVFFPTEETNVAAVTLYAAVGIPVFILALIARIFINKWGQKKVTEKKNKQ